MLPKFADRKEELNFLNEIYKQGGFRLCVLYGRRRVGKTELIKKFIEKHKAIYVLATDESFRENARIFKKKFAEFTKKDYFLKLETDDLYDLFRFFADEIKNEKCIVTIDEFPYLMATKKGALSLFQRIIDEILKDTNVFLILCGSFVSIMENKVLGKGTPLYGRKINSWKLMPFKFSKIVEQFKNPFEVYFVFGNIPYYLAFYDESKNFMENIKANMLTKGRNLYDEPLILLKQEFREPKIYRLILKYISLGYKSIGKLCSATGMDKSNLMKYLTSLQELNIVRHITPFGMKRKGIYEIVDPFFRFWFRFVYPFRDFLEVGNVHVVIEKIQKEIENYFGKSFEYLIEELLINKEIKKFEDFNAIYKWWHKDKEIDILAVNEYSKELLACECKWQSRVNAERLAKQLVEKLEFVDWYNAKRKESLAIFAKSFSKRIKSFNGRKVYCFDLKDLEKVLKRNSKIEKRKIWKGLK